MLPGVVGIYWCVSYGQLVVSKIMRLHKMKFVAWLVLNWLWSDLDFSDMLAGVAMEIVALANSINGGYANGAVWFSQYLKRSLRQEMRAKCGGWH